MTHGPAVLLPEDRAFTTAAALQVALKYFHRAVVILVWADDERDRLRWAVLITTQSYP